MEKGGVANLSHITKIKVALGEVLADGNIKRDLCVVIMVAQLQVFIHVIFDHKGLVAVQTTAPTVGVQQRGERKQILLTERCDESLVKAELIQEDLMQTEEENVTDNFPKMSHFFPLSSSVQVLNGGYLLNNSAPILNLALNYISSCLQHSRNSQTL